MKLSRGDTIDVIAPGSIGERAHLVKATKILQDRGYQVRWPHDLYGPTKIVSQTDERRFAHLREALVSNSKLIWCARGGYGTLRLLPLLKKLKCPLNKKLLLGYSDITSLHVFLNQYWSWPTLHGPLLDRLGRGVMSRREQNLLFSILEGEKTSVKFENLKVLSGPRKFSQPLRATVVGGNLVTAQSTLGTPFALNGRNQFLFFEEIGERAYRVDRILQHMRQAGLFARVKAVLFGDIVGVAPEEKRLIVSQVLKPFAQSSPFPVVTGLQVGHGSIQKVLPFLTPAMLEFSGSRARLEVQVPSW
jgi:muramoyltetrapeptide carboxypeptidase